MKEFFLRRKIKKYERALAKYGDNPAYFHKLADWYSQLAQREAAIAYYHKAIETYYQDDSRLGQHNEFIIGVCGALLKLDPMDAMAHRTLGQEYCSLGEFEQAAELYKMFALKLIQTGQYHDAILQYRNALVLFPENLKWRQECFALLWKLHQKEEAVQELCKIAELAEKMGYLAKAAECYQKALKIMPNNIELQAELRRLGLMNRHTANQLRLVVNNDA
jgi:tetratricopeptide (TPR) repeat protein